MARINKRKGTDIYLSSSYANRCVLSMRHLTTAWTRLFVCTEQLDMVENALGRINGCMHDAEEDLKNLEKCCGLCTLPWNQ